VKEEGDAAGGMGQVDDVVMEVVDDVEGMEWGDGFEGRVSGVGVKVEGVGGKEEVAGGEKVMEGGENGEVDEGKGLKDNDDEAR
jgi:hypothetical protein